MSSTASNDKPQPRCWKLYLALTILSVGAAAGAAAWIEIQESNFQAEYFSQLAKT